MMKGSRFCIQDIKFWTCFVKVHILNKALLFVYVALLCVLPLQEKVNYIEVFVI